MANVLYRTVEFFAGWKESTRFFQNLIDEYNAKSILEIGSGANPTLSLNYVIEKNLEYTTNDISQEELNKAKSGYKKLLLDFSRSHMPFSIENSYDFIFSRMVNEHIKNGKKYYSNIFKALKKGGISVHCFSTLYALPFLINRLTPRFISNVLLYTFAPRNKQTNGEFRAYYSWSRGPTKTMIKRFESMTPWPEEA